jgi:hypothetical protein
MDEAAATEVEAVATTAFGKWRKPLAFGIVFLCLVQFGWWILLEISDPRYSPYIGGDYRIYHDAAVRVLSGGSWFFPEQLTGQPYEAVWGHVMYPPVSMAWMIPATFLPELLWWLIPVSVIGAIVVNHRPSPWGWAGIAACLAWPWSAPILMAGNPGLWIAAACALGTKWRPAFALILAKPSLFPFALLGVRDRGWWLIVSLGLVVSLATLPWTAQWLGVIANAQGQFSGPLYAIRDVGWMLLPLVAWRTTTRSTAPVP